MDNNYKNIDQCWEEKKQAKKKKKLILAIIAGALALTTAITGAVLEFNFFGKKKKNNDDANNKTSVSSVSDTKNTSSLVSINDIGNELEFKKDNKSKYGEVTGNVDLNKIVEKNGTIYADKNSADKSDKVGTVIYDTKGDTLIINPDGTAIEKEVGYEVKDENGNVIDSGEGKIPDGYVWDSTIDKYILEEEAGKYVYADSNYYDSYGNIVIYKGELVAKETLEKAKKYLYTTKPIQSEVSTDTDVIVDYTTDTDIIVEDTTDTDVIIEDTDTEIIIDDTDVELTIEEGIINPDGTYTIYGMTFLSKEDYEQWVLQGFEGYGEIDGIMQVIPNEIKPFQKVIR